MHAHERLDAWRLCRELTIAVYRMTQHWPRHEMFGLISQVRRAAVSAETNIAEGAAKRGPREFRRFLDISNGSLAEVASLLSLARDLAYLTPDAWKEVEETRDRAGRVTWLLYKSIKANTVRSP
jgi:four helix bundle protein